jgi:hypothetical protein
MRVRIFGPVFLLFLLTAQQDQKELEKRLEAKVDISIKGLPLSQALEKLEQIGKVKIILDNDVYEDFHIDELKVTLEEKNITVKDALNKMLKDRLSFALGKDFILVSTKKRIE